MQHEPWLAQYNHQLNEEDKTFFTSLRPCEPYIAKLREKHF